MAEMRVAIDGGTGALAGVTAGGAILADSGVVTASTTLSAITTNTTGTTVDFGATKTSFSWQVVVNSGTVTGSPVYTLEGSLDGTNFASTGVTTTTATGHLGFAVDKPVRYARVTLSGATGTFNVTVKLAAV